MVRSIVPDVRDFNEFGIGQQTKRKLGAIIYNLNYCRSEKTRTLLSLIVVAKFIAPLRGMHNFMYTNTSSHWRAPTLFARSRDQDGCQIGIKIYAMNRPGFEKLKETWYLQPIRGLVSSKVINCSITKLFVSIRLHLVSVAATGYPGNHNRCQSLKVGDLNEHAHFWDSFDLVLLVDVRTSS